MKWQYIVEELNFQTSIPEVEGKLNEIGGGGWEAVAVFPGTGGKFLILFKQPAMRETQKPAGF